MWQNISETSPVRIVELQYPSIPEAWRIICEKRETVEQWIKDLSNGDTFSCSVNLDQNQDQNRDQYQLKYVGIQNIYPQTKIIGWIIMALSAGVLFLISICGFYYFLKANYRCQCMYSKIEEPLLSTKHINETDV
jgi:hypothetical protein